MATRDQKGEADDPDAYVRARPGGERFDLRATYRVRSVASAASLDLAASVRSSAGWWKLQVRDPDRFRELRDVGEPAPHPLFTIVPGDVREWEKRPEEPGSKPKPR